MQIEGPVLGPCRMKYSLWKEDKELVKSTYILSKKDIYGLDYIKRLIDAGVSSLKIEGRNKLPEYVAGVTKTYRKYIDKVIVKTNAFDKTDIYIEQKDKDMLHQLFNRDGQSTRILK